MIVSSKLFKANPTLNFGVSKGFCIEVSKTSLKKAIIISRDLEMHLQKKKRRKKILKYVISSEKK